MHGDWRAVAVQDENGGHAYDPNAKVRAKEPDERVELPGDLLLRLSRLRANGLHLRERRFGVCAGRLQLVPEDGECSLCSVEFPSEPIEPSLGLGGEHVDGDPEAVELSLHLFHG
jgi:hypothetical protein